ncbi:MAG TPA: beta-ketoacyl synthase chain length factor [Methylophilaceae bacterium]|nr:beta-ketoacyl synthase chain length factor [Methylophilaceae bacterium]
MTVSTTREITAFIEGIGLIGPGFNGWPSSRDVLAGNVLYQPQKTILPIPELLPAAERRRSSDITKLSLATMLEAISAAGLEAANLRSVFASSSGDGYNCHAINEMLASEDRDISPTRFHNSVHNAASGYCSIATGAMTPSSVLCAYDGSFSAGLLEALTQVAVDNTHCVLIAGDTGYPEPMHSVRKIYDALGIALVLASEQGSRAIAKITVSITDAEASQLEDTVLEALRLSVPAARGLPLLHALALNQPSKVVLDYLGSTRLAVAVTPC